MLVKTKDEKRKLIAYAAAAFAASALICRSQILGFPSPLAISVSASCAPICSVFMLIGTILSFVLYGNIVENFYIMLSLGICAVLRVLLFSSKEYTPKKSAYVAFFSFLSGSAALLFAKNDDYGLVQHILASLIAAFGAFSAKTAFDSICEKKYLALNSKGSFSICSSYVLAISLLSSVNAGAVNAGIIAGMTASLCVSKHLGKQSGCACAALSVLGTALYSPASARITALMPAFILISSIFHEKEKKYSAAVFAASNIAYCILASLTADGLAYLINVLAASLIFSVYRGKDPGKVFESVPLENLHSDELLEKRMRFMACALKELRKDTVYVSQMLEKHSKLPNTPNHLSATFCRKCDNRKKCWEERETEAYKAFGFFHRNSAVSPATLPKYFDDCPNRMEISKEYGFFEKEKALEKSNENMRRQMQSSIFSLLEAQEETFFYASQFLKHAENSNYDLSMLANNVLKEYTNNNTFAAVFKDDEGQIGIEAYFDGADIPDENEICNALSEAFDTELSIDEVLRTSDSTKLIFSENNSETIEFAFLQSSAEDDICGDYCLNFSDGFGNTYTALSDGMGHGREAALNARFCLSLFKKLTCSGISPNAAAGLINAAMSIKDSSDSFATLDVTKINTKTGKTELFKSGASATLVRTDNRVICIKAASFPLGIVSTAEPYKKTLSLKSGDEFVMLSDGIEEEYYQYIKSLLLHKQDYSAKKLAGEICSTVSESYRNGKKDDITVCVGIVK